MIPPIQHAALSTLVATLALIPSSGQDPGKADPTNTATLSWKEWINVVVDLRFAQSQERIARLEEKLSAAATALAISEEMLKLRLAHLNDLTEEMRGRDRLYAQAGALQDLALRVDRLTVTTASSAETSNLGARLNSIENWRSALEGDMAGKARGSEPMMIVLWAAIGAVLTGVVSLVITRVRRNGKNP